MPEPVGGDAQRGGDPGNGVELLGEVGHEEAVDHVERAELEHDRLVLGQVSSGETTRPAAPGVGELERELALGDVDRHLAFLLLLVGAEHRVGVGAEREIRIAGSAVQTTSSRVLPWIGGPSLFSSPGRIRNFQTENRTTVSTSTKIGTDAISRTS